MNTARSRNNLFLFYLVIISAILITTNGENFSKLKNYQQKVNKDPMGTKIRVMTFNLWNCGINVYNGLYKIAKHILYIYPDIVALEEVVSPDALANLTRYLGPEWSSIGRNMSRPDSAILTRHRIMPTQRSNFNQPSPSEENGSVRAKVNVTLSNGDSLVVNAWALHLDYHDYGPYAACNRRVTDAYQIDAGEAYLSGGGVPGRIQNIHKIVTDENFSRDLQAASREPMLVMGDLNSPSHLDWTEQAKHLHCEWAYQWPVTKVITSLGLLDAFRQLYPDPVSSPGNTWSTVQKFEEGWGGTIPEPQDRIDMIFYRSAMLTPTKARNYAGFEQIKPKPNVWYNDWPSDHASVVVDFVVNKRNG